MDINFMEQAIQLVAGTMDENQGGPFGAIIVKEGKVVAKGVNQVTSKNNPILHAEIVAIQEACKKLNTFDLTGCEMYVTCEPCPMCLGAIYWARIDKIYYAATRSDAAQVDFDDELFYKEIQKQKEKRKVPMIQCLRDESLALLKKWDQKEDKVLY